MICRLLNSLLTGPAAFVMCGLVFLGGSGLSSSACADDAARSAEQAIREHIASYVETFNQHDAEAVGAYWAEDGVSVNRETGRTTDGRAALVDEMKEFLADSPNAVLTGEVNSIRFVRPDVASVEGRTTLFLDDDQPVESTFSALLIREGDKWLISSSHESSIPVPPSREDALAELAWLVGEWVDDSEDNWVHSRFQWSPSGAFLIRSFHARFDDDTALEGTQVFGWDPASKRIRSWTFASDGSFGEGDVVRDDDEWVIRKWQILGDGRVANATRILSRSGTDEMTLRTIGHTVDGVPVPSADPVTVIRVEEQEQAAAADSEAGEDSDEGADQ